MRCPFCYKPDSRVIDSRPFDNHNRIRRRRRCDQCEKRFTSYESAELNYPYIIKSDKKRERFDEEKIRKGVLRALEKRPVPIDQVEKMFMQIMQEIQEQGVKELPSVEIGNIVIRKLRDIDEVAYVRYASVYYSFTDKEAFIQAIESLDDELPADIKKSQLELLKKTN